MSRRTVVYLVVLALLGVLLVVQRTRPQGPTPIAFKLPAVAEADATRLVLTSGEKKVVLVKQGASWQQESPLPWPADATAVGGVIKAFEKEIPMDFRVSSNPEDQTTYELTEAEALKLELFTKSADTPEIAVYIGKSGPMGTSFIRPVGSADIYRAKVGAKARFERSAEDWRDKRVLIVDEAQVNAVKIEGAGLTTVSLRLDGSSWVADEPAGLKVDQTTAKALARSVASLRSSEILDAAPAEAALDAPLWTVSVGFGAGGADVLRIGAAKGEGSAYVARQSDGRAFVVRDSLLTGLKRDPDALRDRTLATFAPEAVRRLSVSLGATQLVLEAGENPDEWKVGAGAPPPNLTPQSLKALLTTLGGLRAVDFSPVGPAEAGLEGDAVLAVELDVGAATPVRVEFGGEVEEGKVYARADGGPVVTVRSSVAQSVRRLLPGG